jgi:hypothetical protein
LDGSGVLFKRLAASNLATFELLLFVLFVDMFFVYLKDGVLGGVKDDTDDIEVFETDEQFDFE